MLDLSPQDPRAAVIIVMQRDELRINVRCNDGVGRAAHG